MASNQLLRLDERSNVVKELFKNNQDRMLKMAPRNGTDANRLLSIAFTSVAYDEKLVQCTPQSILGGVFEALKLGLTIGGPAQEAFLIPFKNGKTGKLEATFIVGYQGLRNIIDRGKGVIDMHPRAVYEGDDFEVVYGTPRDRITHRPFWQTGRAKGQLIAVYVIANLRGGGQQIEVMPKAEVDEHRARSRAKDSGPWVNDYTAMALKTVVRKAAKYLPKSSELLSRALDLDDKADRGVPQDFEIAGFAVPQDGPKPPALDALTASVVGSSSTSDMTPEESAALDAELAKDE